MGCIEISMRKEHKATSTRLIETWDVLKFYLVCFHVVNVDRINRNMGCIEIGTDYTEKEADGRLIETWDVLKFLRFCDKGMWVLD